MARLVIPAEIYDMYEFMCLIFGGIGAGQLSDGAIIGKRVPVCQRGYRDFANGWFDWTNEMHGTHPDYFPGLEAYLTITMNDRAVHAVNAAKGEPNRDARISWEEYCRELNIVRGE